MTITMHETRTADRVAPAAFARPSDLTPGVLAAAESLWDSPNDTASDDTLAALLGLGPGDGHDELARCEHPDCDGWHWADCGAVVAYPSGRDMQMCAEHAVADDPGAIVYPGRNCPENGA